jgi:hypothetical protein
MQVAERRDDVEDVVRRGCEFRKQGIYYTNKRNNAKPREDKGWRSECVGTAAPRLSAGLGT